MPNAFDQSRRGQSSNKARLKHDKTQRQASNDHETTNLAINRAIEQAHRPRRDVPPSEDQTAALRSFTRSGQDIERLALGIDDEQQARGAKRAHPVPPHTSRLHTALHIMHTLQAMGVATPVQPAITPERARVKAMHAELERLDAEFNQPGANGARNARFWQQETQDRQRRAARQEQNAPAPPMQDEVTAPSPDTTAPDALELPLPAPEGTVGDSALQATISGMIGYMVSDGDAVATATAALYGLVHGDAAAPLPASPDTFSGPLDLQSLREQDRDLTLELYQFEQEGAALSIAKVDPLVEGSSNVWFKVGDPYYEQPSGEPGFHQLRILLFNPSGEQIRTLLLRARRKSLLTRIESELRQQQINALYGPPCAPGGAPELQYSAVDEAIPWDAVRLTGFDPDINFSLTSVPRDHLISKVRPPGSGIDKNCQPFISEIEPAEYESVDGVTVGQMRVHLWRPAHIDLDEGGECATAKDVSVTLDYTDTSPQQVESALADASSALAPVLPELDKCMKKVEIFEGDPQVISLPVDRGGRFTVSATSNFFQRTIGVNNLAQPQTVVISAAAEGEVSLRCTDTSRMDEAYQQYWKFDIDIIDVPWGVAPHHTVSSHLGATRHVFTFGDFKLIIPNQNPLFATYVKEKVDDIIYRVHRRDALSVMGSADIIRPRIRSGDPTLVIDAPRGGTVELNGSDSGASLLVNTFPQRASLIIRLKPRSPLATGPGHTILLDFPLLDSAGYPLYGTTVKETDCSKRYTVENDTGGKVIIIDESGTDDTSNNFASFEQTRQKLLAAEKKFKWALQQIQDVSKNHYDRLPTAAAKVYQSLMAKLPAEMAIPEWDEKRQQFDAPSYILGRIADQLIAMEEIVEAMRGHSLTATQWRIAVYAAQTHGIYYRYNGRRLLHFLKILREMDDSQRRACELALLGLPHDAVLTQGEALKFMVQIGATLTKSEQDQADSAIAHARTPRRTQISSLPSNNIVEFGSPHRTWVAGQATLTSPRSGGLAPIKISGFKLVYRGTMKSQNGKIAFGTALMSTSDSGMLSKPSETNWEPLYVGGLVAGSYAVYASKIPKLQVPALLVETAVGSYLLFSSVAATFDDLKALLLSRNMHGAVILVKDLMYVGAGTAAVAAPAAGLAANVLDYAAQLRVTSPAAADELAPAPATGAGGEVQALPEENNDLMHPEFADDHELGSLEAGLYDRESEVSEADALESAQAAQPMQQIQEEADALLAPQQDLAAQAALEESADSLTAELEASEMMQFLVQKGTELLGQASVTATAAGELSTVAARTSVALTAIAMAIEYFNSSAEAIAELYVFVDKLASQYMTRHSIKLSLMSTTAQRDAQRLVKHVLLNGVHRLHEELRACEERNMGWLPWLVAKGEDGVDSLFQNSDFSYLSEAYAKHLSQDAAFIASRATTTTTTTMKPATVNRLITPQEAGDLLLEGLKRWIKPKVQEIEAIGAPQVPINCANPSMFKKITSELNFDSLTCGRTFGSTLWNDLSFKGRNLHDLLFEMAEIPAAHAEVPRPGQEDH